MNNSYFAPYQEEGTPETVKHVESRCLPAPGFYAVMLLELLRSHLRVLEGQRVGEKEEFCVTGSRVVVSEDAVAEIWGPGEREGQMILTRRS